MAELINPVAAIINKDHVCHRLEVMFIPNYKITIAQRI
jgi:glucan phosphorylase